MTTKKKLITRMAFWASLVLAVGALVAGGSLLIQSLARSDWERAEQRRRAELFESSRVYVDELAGTIDAVPVDANLVNQVEARYFAEYEEGPLAVWAMGVDGSFLFGVPRETFSRMNAVYDREITPRLSEGVFFDRQSFFLGQLDEDGETLLLGDLAGDLEGEEADVYERLLEYADRSGDSFVLSAPLQSSEGVALGSLYLSRAMPDRRYFRRDDRLQFISSLGGFMLGGSALFLWILLPTWVYVDARERRVARAPLFAFLTALSSVVGLLVYLIARPEAGATLQCPGCDQEVNGGAYCPHCGRDLSASFCQTCRYPLEPDWAFCPSCRTSVGARSSEEPPSGEPDRDDAVAEDAVAETG